MLKNVNFFKTRRPRQFEYKPIYYDEQKEKRQKRIAELTGNKVYSKDALRDRVNFRNNKDAHSNPQSGINRFYGIRMMIIIGLLLVVSYWVYQLLDKVQP